MDETTPVLNFPYAPLGYLMATAAMIGALMLAALAVRSLFANRAEPGRS